MGARFHCTCLELHENMHSSALNPHLTVGVGMKTGIVSPYSPHVNNHPARKHAYDRSLPLTSPTTQHEHVHSSALIPTITPHKQSTGIMNPSRKAAERNKKPEFPHRIDTGRAH